MIRSYHENEQLGSVAMIFCPRRRIAEHLQGDENGAQNGRESWAGHSLATIAQGHLGRIPANASIPIHANT